MRTSSSPEPPSSIATRSTLETSRHEQQSRRRRLVEPVGVVDDAPAPAAFGRLREQAQRAEEDEEPVARIAGLLAERHSQRSGLRLRDPAHVPDSGASRRWRAAKAKGASDSIPDAVRTVISPISRAVATASASSARLSRPSLCCQQQRPAHAAPARPPSAR